VTAQDDWQRWCDRFDKLHNGILRLFHDRGIWRTILAMLDANPQVARGGFGEYWLGSCYTDSMLIGIRRETGADSHSIGIRRSLNNLASNPRMATRSWHEQEVRQRNQGRDAWERHRTRHGVCAVRRLLLPAHLIRHTSIRQST
jgi:hypothetical protein